MSLAGEQQLTRFALADPSYDGDDAPSTAILSVDTDAETFTLTADHGIETGDVIYLAGVGAANLEYNKPGTGFVALESNQAFFAIVDGNSLEWPSTRRKRLRQCSTDPR